MTAKQDL